MRNRLSSLAAVVIGLWLAGSAIAGAQAVLAPPFGLRWGDTPEKLIVWASRHSLDVSISLPGDQPDLRIIRIAPREGKLPGSAAQALEGRFHRGRLFEVAIHYREPDTAADTMEARFNKLKKELAAEYGPLSANQQERSVVNGFATRTASFHREPVKGLLLLLAYSEVHDQLRQTREATFSLLYRNDNLRRNLDNAAGSDGRETGGEQK
ncbi:MAG: hypothetical protein EAZ84_11605 [Verrucomicrobia bacterium]|nr:MAG: hypothetical protein EAZ84_11605 [Verrucomicrobiota bacterium]TAE88715.1 MAG: hypothetical protein EAZ82_03170 [Verrucomicrobiota bacterium]TAF26517.1 MAG: hypothetical protein EAZ71_04695 [Verrucomicrobiota bacterium]